jgi:hypothetical protein
LGPWFLYGHIFLPVRDALTAGGTSRCHRSSRRHQVMPAPELPLLSSVSSNELHHAFITSTFLFFVCFFLFLLLHAGSTWLICFRLSVLLVIKEIRWAKSSVLLINIYFHLSVAPEKKHRLPSAYNRFMRWEGIFFLLFVCPNALCVLHSTCDLIHAVYGLWFNFWFGDIFPIWLITCTTESFTRSPDYVSKCTFDFSLS